MSLTLSDALAIAQGLRSGKIRLTLSPDIPMTPELEAWLNLVHETLAKEYERRIGQIEISSEMISAGERALIAFEMEDDPFYKRMDAVFQAMIATKPD